MIPDDNNNHNTPKRFDLGYWCRETAELFHAGWTVASRHMLEYRRQEQARETRKHIVSLLEEGLYDNVSRGTPEQKLQALKYFQQKKESELKEQPYTLGEQFSSLVFYVIWWASMIVLLSVIPLSLTFVLCKNNQSQFCKDVRSTTGGLVRSFSDPKL